MDDLKLLLGALNHSREHPMTSLAIGYSESRSDSYTKASGGTTPDHLNTFIRREALEMPGKNVMTFWEGLYEGEGAYEFTWIP